MILGDQKKQKTILAETRSKRQLVYNFVNGGGDTELFNCMLKIHLSASTICILLWTLPSPSLRSDGDLVLVWGVGAGGGGGSLHGGDRDQEGCFTAVTHCDQEKHDLAIINNERIDPRVFGLERVRKPKSVPNGIFHECAYPDPYAKVFYTCTYAQIRTQTVFSRVRIPRSVRSGIFHVYAYPYPYATEFSTCTHAHIRTQTVLSTSTYAHVRTRRYFPRVRMPISVRKRYFPRVRVRTSDPYAAGGFEIRTARWYVYIREKKNKKHLSNKEDQSQSKSAPYLVPYILKWNSQVNCHDVSKVTNDYERDAQVKNKIKKE